MNYNKIVCTYNCLLFNVKKKKRYTNGIKQHSLVHKGIFFLLQCSEPVKQILFKVKTYLKLLNYTQFRAKISSDSSLGNKNVVKLIY